MHCTNYFYNMTLHAPIHTTTMSGITGMNGGQCIDFWFDADAFTKRRGRRALPVPLRFRMDTADDNLYGVIALLRHGLAALTFYNAADVQVPVPSEFVLTDVTRKKDIPVCTTSTPTSTETGGCGIKTTTFLPLTSRANYVARYRGVVVLDIQRSMKSSVRVPRVEADARTQLAVDVFSVYKKLDWLGIDVIKFCNDKGTDVPVPPEYEVVLVPSRNKPMALMPERAGFYSTASHFVLEKGGHYQATYRNKRVLEIGRPGDYMSAEDCDV